MTVFEWFVVIALAVIFLAVILQGKGYDEEDPIKFLQPQPMTNGEYYAIREAAQLRAHVDSLYKENCRLRESDHYECTKTQVVLKMIDPCQFDDKDLEAIKKKLGIDDTDIKVEDAKKRIDYNSHDLGEFGKVIRTGYAKDIIEDNFGGKSN